jgi:ABC-type transport system substrate-binding protein
MRQRIFLVAGAIGLTVLTSPIDVPAQQPRSGGVFRIGVPDPPALKLLLAQRREMDRKRRREIIHEIQRYLADRAYYVNVPMYPRYISHPPYVKGFKHHDGYDLGRRLTYTWIDRSP